MSSNSLTCGYCGNLFAGTDSQQRYCCPGCETMGSLVEPGTINKPNSYGFLDSGRSLYRHKTNSFSDAFSIFIEGIHCPQCITTLEGLHSFNQKIINSNIDFGRSLLSVELAKDGLLSEVAALIEDLGYKPHFLKPEDNSVDKEKKENRSSLQRIAIAGAVAGNIMLFTIPVYAGLESSWAMAFTWISFAIFLPLIFYSAVPFYRGAWASLKYKRISIDLPIVIALWLGFVMSTFNLFRGSTEVYFDSTASFIFLILSTRYLVKRSQQKFLLSAAKKPLLPEDGYTLINGNNSQVGTSQLKAGDQIHVNSGQIIPGDGTLLSDFADIDLSLLRGEAIPKTEQKGARLFAGTKAATPLIMTISHTSQTSQLSSLVDDIQKDAVKKSYTATRVDRLAQLLIGTVLLVALAVFLIYSQKSFSMAFSRTLALIVVACPCALALGAPLTYALALKKGLAKGIFIKSPDALEKIAKVKNLFLDKTGTLTTGELKLVEEKTSEFNKGLILGLEAQSSHPVAYAFRSAWKNIKPLPVTNVREQPGMGVSGLYNGCQYFLRRNVSAQQQSKMSCTLWEDSQPVQSFWFTDSLHASTSSTLEKLRSIFSAIFILSGDNPELTKETGKVLSIPEANIYFQLSPQDKKQVLLDHGSSCMLGDGANDALAFQNADVSIAVKGSVELSLKNADVYFANSGLSSLIDFLDLSKVTQQTLKRNFSISLIYNLIGGFLAISGGITPLVAAILMPVSSLVILLSTLWRLR